MDAQLFRSHFKEEDTILPNFLNSIFLTLNKNLSASFAIHYQRQHLRFHREVHTAISPSRKNDRVSHFPLGWENLNIVCIGKKCLIWKAKLALAEATMDPASDCYK